MSDKIIPVRRADAEFIASLPADAVTAFWGHRLIVIRPNAAPRYFNLVTREYEEIGVMEKSWTSGQKEMIRK